MAAGGAEGCIETGGKGAVAGKAIHHPFEGDAVVEGEEEAEALGGFLVAHDRGIGDGDPSVRQPLLDAAGIGPDDGLAVAEGAAGDGAVERGIEVGQAGA